MTKQDIVRLRAQAEAEFKAAEAKYKQRIDAIKVVEGMIPLSGLDTSLATIETQFGSLPLSQSPRTTPIGEQPTVMDAVRSAILSAPERRWPVSEIVDHLRSRDFKFTAKDPKSTVNTALTRLVEQGAIQVSVRGKGRKPSLYKASDRAVTRSENSTEVEEVKDAAA